MCSPIQKIETIFLELTVFTQGRHIFLIKSLKSMSNFFLEKYIYPCEDELSGLSMKIREKFVRWMSGRVGRRTWGCL